VYERDFLPVPGTKERVTSLEFKPRATVRTHTHPGAEGGIVTAGRLMLKVANSPCTPFTAGQMFVVPPNTPMTVKNSTNQPATLMTLVVGYPPGHHIVYVAAQNCPD
jgi:quercetin dioxygenase-like cupin family protein